MEKPYRYRKRIMKSGNGNYVLLPASWIKKNATKEDQEVIVEVFAKTVIITPLK